MDKKLRAIIATVKSVAAHRRVAGGSEEALLFREVLPLRRAPSIANGDFFRGFVLGHTNDRRVRLIVNVTVRNVHAQALTLCFVSQPHAEFATTACGAVFELPRDNVEVIVFPFALKQLLQFLGDSSW